MKAVEKLGIALAVASALASPVSFADNKGGKVPRAFDVCVRAGTDNTAIPGTFVPGEVITAVGMMLPANTLPLGGPLDCQTNSGHLKIGTFFVRAQFVAQFFNPGNRLPQAAADDLAYVDWHFRVDGTGAFESSGPIKQFVQGGTFPQVLTGGTGRFKNVKGELTTQMLGAGGFQIRVFLPND